MESNNDAPAEAAALPAAHGQLHLPADPADPRHERQSDVAGFPFEPPIALKERRQEEREPVVVAQMGGPLARVESEGGEVIGCAVDTIGERPRVDECQTATLAEMWAGGMGRVAEDKNVSRVPARHPDVSVCRENELVEACDWLGQFARLGAEINKLVFEWTDATRSDGAEIADRDAPIQAAPSAADWQDTEKSL